MSDSDYVERQEAMDMAADAALDLAARCVELEQRLLRVQGELDKAIAWLDRAGTWRNHKLDLDRGPLEAQVVELEAEVARLKSQQSVTQQVAEANLMGRCGFCGSERPEAELINGDCADAGKCVARLEAREGAR